MESARARFPFSNTPENFVVGVGAGVTVAVETVVDGEGEEVGEVVVVGVGEGAVVGVGVGVGEGVIVGTSVGSPAPGQVCDKRIPESEPLMVASDPA